VVWAGCGAQKLDVHQFWRVPEMTNVNTEVAERVERDQFEVE
jgi:hypothetical protein